MKNKVTLLGFYGGDKTHCLSAWQSTNVELNVPLPEEISERITVLFEETQRGKKKSAEELLCLLASHGHHTPFEKSTLHFQLTADIASHIHHLKHRVGVSINGESARYKELQDKWYVPEDFYGVKVKNPLIVKGLGEGVTWGNVLENYSRLGHELYHTSCEELTKELGRKRAKESSRYFLGYNKQMDYDLMVNFRSFWHMYRLRASDSAQEEIKNILEEMLKLVTEIPGDPFKLSLKAFNLT